MILGDEGIQLRSDILLCPAYVALASLATMMMSSSPNAMEHNVRDTSNIRVQMVDALALPSRERTCSSHPALPARLLISSDHPGVPILGR